MKKLFLILFLVPLFIHAQDVKSLELDDVNGDTFVMEDNLNYDATVISFWATWCLPCQKEHPALLEVQKELGADKVQFISISIDSPRSLAKVKSYVRSHKYPFIFLVDPSGEEAQQMLVNEIPYTMLVNREGKVVFRHTGYRKGDEQELKTEIEKLLKTKK